MRLALVKYGSIISGIRSEDLTCSPKASPGKMLYLGLINPGNCSGFSEDSGVATMLPTVLQDLRSICLPHPSLEGYFNTPFEIQGHM